MKAENTITQKVEEALVAAREKISGAKTEAEVEQAKVEYLGRKGLFPALSKDIKDVPPEGRQAAGMALNKLKTEVQAMLDARLEELRGSSAGAARQSVDVSLPGRRWPHGSRHPVTMVMDECVEIFRRMGFIVADGPEIESVHNNFDALNTPPEHPSRDPQDTFYFADGRLLRTQTSPIQIRVMESRKPPVRIVAPGRCFRRDTPDATHGLNFHQIEGLYIDRGVSLSDLKSVLLKFAHELLGPDVGIRLRPHFFPFTEPSVEYDFSCIMCGGKGCRVCKNSGWLEISGAGMVDPNVLRAVGYDPEEVGGFAFGMGIERIAMIRHRVGDIRILYENDARFLKQF